MRYNAIVIKRVKYARVYTIINRLGPKPNIITRAFSSVLARIVKNAGES